MENIYHEAKHSHEKVCEDSSTEYGGSVASSMSIEAKSNKSSPREIVKSSPRESKSSPREIVKSSPRKKSSPRTRKLSVDRLSSASLSDGKINHERSQSPGIMSTSRENLSGIRESHKDIKIPTKLTKRSQSVDTNSNKPDISCIIKKQSELCHTPTKYKCFYVDIMSGLAQVELLIRHANYNTFDLVHSGYSGVEIAEKNSSEIESRDVQQYIVYSEMGFRIHDTLILHENNLDERNILDSFKDNFPMIVKSISHSYSEEEFLPIFKKLMYSMNLHITSQEGGDCL